MKNKIFFKCPYNEFSCPHVDTATATLDVSCSKKCEHYNNGVRSTGNVHIFDILKNLFKKKK